MNVNGCIRDLPKSEISGSNALWSFFLVEISVDEARKMSFLRSPRNCQ